MQPNTGVNLAFRRKSKTCLNKLKFVASFDLFVSYTFLEGMPRRVWPSVQIVPAGGTAIPVGKQLAQIAVYSLGSETAE